MSTIDPATITVPEDLALLYSVGTGGDVTYRYKKSTGDPVDLDSKYILALGVQLAQLPRFVYAADLDNVLAKQAVNAGLTVAKLCSLKADLVTRDTIVNSAVTTLNTKVSALEQIIGVTGYEVVASTEDSEVVQKNLEANKWYIVDQTALEGTLPTVTGNAYIKITFNGQANNESSNRRYESVIKAPENYTIQGSSEVTFVYATNRVVELVLNGTNWLVL